MMNKYAHMFRWAVVLGVVQDLVLAVPGIFAPNWVLKLVHAEPAADPIWTAFACLILVLLSIFYIPPAINLHRHVPLALFTVVARLGGVIFFFGIYPGVFPPLFGYIDLFLTVLQGGLLVAALFPGPVPSQPSF